MLVHSTGNIRNSCRTSKSTFHAGIRREKGYKGRRGYVNSIRGKARRMRRIEGSDAFASWSRDSMSRSSVDRFSWALVGEVSPDNSLTYPVQRAPLTCH